MEEMGQKVFDPENAGEAAVARWLHSGLVAYKAKKSRWVFGALALHIGHGDDVAHDLLGVFETLTDGGKQRWRKAVVALLSDSEIALDSETAVTLIDIAVLIGADEILHVLPAVICGEHAPSSLLLNRVVDAVFELSGKPSSGVACLYAASGAAQFPATSAGLVLVALCKFEPDRWIDHARQLTPAIVSLKKGLGEDSTVLRDYTRKMVTWVTQERLARDWLDLEADRSLEWLRESLAEILDLTQLQRDTRQSLVGTFARTILEQPNIFSRVERPHFISQSAWSPPSTTGDRKIIVMHRPPSVGAFGDGPPETIVMFPEVLRDRHGSGEVDYSNRTLASLRALERSHESEALAGEAIDPADERLRCTLVAWGTKSADSHSTLFAMRPTLTVSQPVEGIQVDRLVRSLRAETLAETTAAT